MSTVAHSDASPLVKDCPCPVCYSAATDCFIVVEDHTYWRCSRCECRFLDPLHHPSREDEYAHYSLHDNRVDDPAYRAFLSRLGEPLLQRLGPDPAEGLDFGCGPGPALAQMMKEAGHSVALYDPFFRPDRSALQRSYDFVTCTEVAEHLHEPAATFETLGRLLRPGGWLGLMTCFQTDDARFANWHYRKDPTHVVFYRESTLRWLAASKGWECDVPRKDVALMRKPL